MKQLLLVSTLFLLSLNVSFAKGKKGITVDVNLSPAGSFQVTSKRVKGKIQKKGAGYVAENVYVSVKSLKTGSDLRDEHTKKRLNKDDKVTIVKAIAKNGKGNGIISINKVKKKFKFVYKELSKKLVEAKFKLNLKDFKIESINYMGIGVENEVTVTAVVPVK